MILRNKGEHFSYQEEPFLNINNNSDRINVEKNIDEIKKAKDLFGDVVEIEEE